MKLVLSSLTFALVVLVAACQSTEGGGAAAQTSGPLARSELGTMSNVTSLGDLHMGGQPSADDLALAARRGFTRVINLRTEAEMERLPFNEMALCAELGLEYVGIPVDFSVLEDASFDLILDQVGVRAPNGGQTLMHCGSGNRVAVFVAIHRMRAEGVPFDEALADAQAAGMKPSLLPILEANVERLGLGE
ncbi:MAG: sulfur transferase domain-containing protein [Planctomycetota bacterium]|nr:sulfur transferase domain-containing protein [Planctomycetota bacterium]